MKKEIGHYLLLPKAIWALFFASIACTFGTIVYSFLPLYLQKNFSLTPTTIGYLIGLGDIAFLCGYLIAGNCSDTIGAKKTMMISLIASAVLAILSTFFNKLALFSFFATGFFLMRSFYYPAEQTLIAGSTTGLQQSYAYSLLYFALNIALTLEAIIGGVLFKINPRLIFVVASIANIFSLAILLFFTKENKKTVPEPPKGEEYKNREFFPHLISKDTRFLFFLISTMLFSIIFAQFLWTMPLYLNNLFADKAATYYSYLLSLKGLITLSLTIPLSYILRKKYPLSNMILGGLSATISSGLLYFNNSFTGFILSTILLSVGEIILVTNTETYIASTVLENFRGKYISIYLIIEAVGYIIGRIMGGYTVQIFNYNNLWLLCFGLGIIGLFGMQFVFLKSKENLNL